MDGLTEILPNQIYLSGDEPPQNKELIKKKGITHVVNATLDIKPLFRKDGVKYLNLRMYDDELEDISRNFEKTNKFINDALKNGGKVLVHCNAGVSRSVTLLSAYLMKTTGMNADDAILFIMKRRVGVDPNDGFRKQLKKYEEKLLDNFVKKYAQP